MIETQTALPERDMPEAWARLESSPLWASATLPQKSFVTVFLATANLSQSVQFAYTMKNASTARVFGYALLKVPKIVDLLSIARGENSMQFDQPRIIVELKKTLAGVDSELRFVSHGVAKQRLLSQRASILKELSALLPETANAKKPVAQPETFSVGEVVQQDGVAYRVTEIDDCGRILEAADV